MKSLTLVEPISVWGRHVTTNLLENISLVIIPASVFLRIAAGAQCKPLTLIVHVKPGLLSLLTWQAMDST
jgi:hypothetical protein